MSKIRCCNARVLGQMVKVQKEYQWIVIDHSVTPEAQGAWIRDLGDGDYHSKRLDYDSNSPP